MFYSNNNGYMEDLYFYNQVPNGTYVNSFGNNSMGNANFQMMQQGNIPNVANGQIFNNQPMYPNNVPVQNISNLYPSIYKILNPVVSRVVLTNNQPITEDLLNNMTDTVFNIVEGQVNYGDDQIQRNNEVQSTSSNNNLANNSNTRTSEINKQNSQVQETSNARNNKGDSLLKDLIKILIIKELLAKNQMQRQYANNFGNPVGYSPFYSNVNF